MGKGKATEKTWGTVWGRGRVTVLGMVLIKTPKGGDDVPCAVALQLQKGLSEADLDTEG
jgi:hypothetical protein